MNTPASLRLFRLLSGLALAAIGLAPVYGQDTTPATPSVAPTTIADDAPALAGKNLHLAFIPKGMENVYWKSVDAGLEAAKKEATDAGIKVRIEWNGPPNEDDRAAQISLMENYVAQHLDGIILCPMDNEALVAPSQRAHRAGIPLVIVDSSLDYKDIVSFVATDNSNAGAMAAKELARELGDKGNVILMRFLAGSASTNFREEAFLAEMKNHPGIKILSSDNYAGGDREHAYAKGSDLLNSFKGQVDGVFTPNEPSTNGMLLALEKAGLAGKVKFVGFDGGQANMDGLNSGEINALVLQDPYKMGYLGVKTMLDHLAGRKIDPVLDTGTVLLTKDNLDTPLVKDLLAHTVQ